MKKWYLGLFFAASLCWGQIPSGDGFLAPNRPSTVSEGSAPTPVPAATGIADVKQDVEANHKDVKDLTLRVEQLERDKAELEAKINKNADPTTFVTHDELKLFEMRMSDAIVAEGKRVEGSIKDDMKAAISSTGVTDKVPDKTAVAVKTPTPKVDKIPSKTAVSIPVSDAEKQSYMKEGIRYVIQSGDTISSIARKNHSSVRAIMATNSISNPGKLFVGREIFVPTL